MGNITRKQLHVDPQAGKRYKGKKEKGGSSLIQNRVGIENRPQVVNERGRSMAFEADTVLSSRGKVSPVLQCLWSVNPDYTFSKRFRIKAY